jgi:C-terminal processing protease CtpA/Prc
MVWDARSNGGGITLVGLAIVAGMPGAQAMGISYCQSRIPGSNPPAFSSQSYAHYQVTPGGPFAYTGKVAVLIDGLDYSAADYFPYAVSQATSALLVGTPTAGAYGASSVEIEFAGPPWLGASLDLNRCVDATGAPLEGRAVEPHLQVEYDPADLAAGVDTVLEAAVAALLAE